MKNILPVICLIGIFMTVNASLWDDIADTVDDGGLKEDLEGAVEDAGID
jgi:hypothetical protein